MLRSLSISICFLLTACNICEDVHCPDYFDRTAVTVKGFQIDEIDSVQITVFEKVSGFTNPMETQTIPNDEITVDRDSDDELRIFLSVTWESNKNYDFTLIGPNVNYRLDDFETFESECGDCTFGHTYSTQLKSYRINGQKVEQREVILLR